MPSLMASIGLDAARFNASAAKVTERTRVMATQMKSVGFSGGAIDAAVKADRLSAMRGELIRSGFSPAAAGAALRADEMAKAANKATFATSALGGAAKMFGAAMAVDMVRRGVVHIAEYADKVGGLSARLGISSEAVQQWDHALKLSNSSIDAAVPFFERLAAAREKAMSGDKKTQASFAAFGIGSEQLETQRIEDLALTISKAFQGGDPQQFVADLRTLGGRGAGAMIEAFSEGLGSMIETNRNSWSVMSNDAVHQIKSAKDQIDIMKQSLTGIGGAVMGVEAEQFNTKMGFYKKMAGAAVGAFKGIGKEGIVAGMKAGWKGQEDEKPIADPAKVKAAAAAAREALEKADEDEKGKKEAVKAEKREQAKEVAELGKTRAHSVGSLQQMGGFLGNFSAAGMSYGPEAAAQATRQKSEQHLAKIEKDIAKLAARNGSSADVEY